MDHLRFLDSDGYFQALKLEGQLLTIGRAETCDVSLVDDLVSREHARIELDAGGRWRLRDLGSRNKSFVNGQVVSEMLLSHGDIVRIGSRIMEFVTDAAEPQISGMEFLTPDREQPGDCQWIKIKEQVSLGTAELGKLGRIFAVGDNTVRVQEQAMSTLRQLLFHLNADRGFVGVRGKDKQELNIVAARGLSRSPGAPLTPVSRAFVFSSLLQSVAGRYPSDAKRIDLDAGYASVGLVAPMVVNGQVTGVVYVDRPKSRNIFDPGSLDLLTAAGVMLGESLAAAFRSLSGGAAAESSAWMTMLRRLQSGLSPRPVQLESFETAFKTLRGAGRCGDFCEVLPMSPHRVVVVCLDAGGAGVESLIQAAGVLTAIRSTLALDDVSLDLGPTFSVINKTLADRAVRQLVPCAAVTVDLPGGRISYVNAGMPPPLLLAGSGRLITLDQVSLLLGIDPMYEYQQTSVDLPIPFRLVCHSDGLPDSANRSSGTLGEQRIHDLLLRHDAFRSCSEIADLLIGALAEHLGKEEPDDDATVFVMGRG